MKKVNILFDSGCDLDKRRAEEIGAKNIPLTIRVDEKIFVDDDNLDREDLIYSIKNANSHPSSACPSPEDYKSKFSKDKGNFIVTLSQKLSGSYNSAVVAKNIFLEDNENSYVDVVDSKSAACGEALVSLELDRLAREGLSFKDISEKIEEYVNNMKTYFIIDSMENLIKTGRVSSLKGKVAQLLSIVPIMKANDGEIEMEQKVRGSKNAFARLVEIIGEQGENIENKILGISHCNALDKAKLLEEQIRKKYNFRDIMIFDTRGIATFYAGEGGIVISF